MNSQINHLIMAALHSKAADDIARGFNVNDVVSIIVGLNGTYSVQFTGGKRLDILHEQADCFAKFHATVETADEKLGEELSVAHLNRESAEQCGGVCEQACEKACEALKEARVKDRPFAAGDVVRLKSGGPLMTIEKINSIDVTCMWHVDGHLHSAEFQPAMLRDATNDLLGG